MIFSNESLTHHYLKRFNGCRLPDDVQTPAHSLPALRGPGSATAVPPGLAVVSDSHNVIFSLTEFCGSPRSHGLHSLLPRLCSVCDAFASLATHPLPSPPTSLTATLSQILSLRSTLALSHLFPVAFPASSREEHGLSLQCTCIPLPSRDSQPFLHSP